MLFEYSRITYGELVSLSFKSEKSAEPWRAYLDFLKRRRDAEKSLIKDCRKSNPGLADYEVLAKYANWLDDNFPVPQLKQQQQQYK